MHKINEEHILTISTDDIKTYKRLDHYLCQQLPDFSRTFIKNLFLNNLITMQNDLGKILKIELKKMPKSIGTISIQIPPPIPIEAQAEYIPLDIIYEDEHLLFINKKAGIVTHPAPGNYTGTLVNALLYYCNDLKSINNRIRPGIVHRLDKGTSGIMVVAKDQKTYEGLVLLFSSHSIDRVYESIIIGNKVPTSGTLTGKIGRHKTHRTKMAINPSNGKDSITHYKVINYYEKFTHLELKLETGRTHQIRVHLSSLLKHAILNDPTYGNPNEHLKRIGNIYRSILNKYEHPLLHAKLLGLIHPITKKKLLFEVPPPREFQEILMMANSK